jgi:hypothetical protein
MEGESPIKCEHCKSRNLDCSQPKELPAALPAKRRAQDDGKPSSTKRRMEECVSTPPAGKVGASISPNHQPTMSTLSAITAASSEKTVSTEALDEATGAADLIGGLGVTSADSNSSPSAASVADNVPQLATVNPGRDQTIPPDALGIEAAKNLEVLNLASQPADIVQILKELIAECDRSNPITLTVTLEFLVQFFAWFKSQKTDLNPRECIDKLHQMTDHKGTCPVGAGHHHETSEPRSPLLQSGISSSVSSA